MTKIIDERNRDPINEMARIAQNSMNLGTRGFKESYRSPKTSRLIYNSNWYRISFIWGGWDYLGGNSIHIRYGRLHAPDEEVTINWNGEKCRCWHRIEYPLHFLDKLLPQDAAKLNYSHPLIEPFYKEEYRQQFQRRQPEWLATIHTAILDNYGSQLIKLFDLQRPELWEQYRKFLKEVYDINGRAPEIEPALDKVC